ncbi:MAG: Rpn family recombination-promoting nuclease/putative transposase [Myxococcota bacterium]|jgi:predicted transposase YdaD|nr:Rpn family recombination-promoting nuclease/putative transposase [Myxococcota bacterium]
MADGNPHDRLFKGVFGDPRRGFAHLRGLLPARLAGALDPGTVRTVSGSYVDSRLRTRESDLLFQVQLAGSPMLVYLLFEHQSRADPRLLCRLQRYLARIWETWERQHPETVQLPPVVPCVLYHGPGAWPGPRRFREALAAPAAVLEQLGPYIPDFGVLLEDLSAVPDEKLKEQALTQLTLLVLKHAQEPDFASTLPRLKSLFVQAVLSDGWQAVCLVLEYCLTVGRDVTEQDLQVLFADSDLPEAQEAIMTLAEKWLQQGWEKGREEGWEKGRQEGRQEGREEGREEGRQEGRQEGQRLLLVRQLRLRFRRLPRAVVARIEAAGPAELERWSERILTARTLAEVMAD